MEIREWDGFWPPPLSIVLESDSQRVGARDVVSGGLPDSADSYRIGSLGIECPVLGKVRVGDTLRVCPLLRREIGEEIRDARQPWSAQERPLPARAPGMSLWR